MIKDKRYPEQKKIMQIYDGTFRKYISQLIVDSSSLDFTIYSVYDLKIKTGQSRIKFFYEDCLIADWHASNDRENIINTLCMDLLEYNSESEAARKNMLKEKLFKKFGNFIKD